MNVTKAVLSIINGLKKELFLELKSDIVAKILSLELTMMTYTHAIDPKQILFPIFRNPRYRHSGYPKIQTRPFI